MFGDKLRITICDEGFAMVCENDDVSPRKKKKKIQV
jgi:hypothetical protein